ncbi:MAG: hypothetical protein JXA64_02625 [Candidatus Fermentibacteraceae bacterium]|nr:hypothetical protein [Candidatus Fermentibacteraceae bacterium]
MGLRNPVPEAAGGYGLIAVSFALLTRLVHFSGYVLGSRTDLYYWPVLACRKFEGAALAILHGAQDSGPFVYASPLYRYLILPFYAAGADRTGLFLFQSLLGALTAWMIFRLSRRAGAGIRTALAASVCWSLYSPAAFFELTILPVAALTALVAAFTLLETEEATGDLKPALFGLIAGLMAGLRPPFMALMSIPLWKWLKMRAWKKTVISLLLLLVPLVFLSIQHQRVGGGFYPFPRTSGTNLVLGHSSESTGYGPPVPSLGLVETGRGDIHEVAAAAAAERGHDTPGSADRYWAGIAITWTVNHPFEEMRLMAVKLGGFFGAGCFDTYYDVGRIGSFNPVLPFFPVPRMLFVLAFLAGLLPFLTGGRHRTVIMAPVALALLSTLAFVHSERYFLPVLPVMAAASAGGLTVLVRGLRRSAIRWSAAGAAGLLLALPGLFYPVPKVPEELYISSLAVRAHYMEDYPLSLELFERAALLSERGSVVWVQGHREAARIASALGDGARAGQHVRILEEAGFPP